jgi:hypothetical protein
MITYVKALSALAVVSATMLTTATAEARCVRKGSFTECTLAQEIDLGDRVLIKQTGGSADARSFKLWLEFSDFCQIEGEVDPDGDGTPNRHVVIASSESGNFLFAFGTDWALTTESGEVLLVEKVAVRRGGLDGDPDRCWGGIHFRYARHAEKLFD